LRRVTHPTGGVADRGGRRGGQAHRPQRRWQDHHAALDHGHRAPPPGSRAPGRRRHHASRDARDRPARDRLGARGAPGPAEPDRAGEPPAGAAGGGRRRRRPPGPGLRVLPAAAAADRPPGGGEHEVRSLARAGVAAPRLMLVDEPTEGLAPLLVESLTEILAAINRRGTTILLVEQTLGVALALSHRIYVVDQGRIQFEGTPAELRRDPTIQQRFLEI